jgi:hypothetical protein
MHRFRTPAAALAAGFAFAACSGDPGGPLTHLPRELSVAEAEIVRAGNASRSACCGSTRRETRRPTCSSRR